MAARIRRPCPYSELLRQWEPCKIHARKRHQCTVPLRFREAHGIEGATAFCVRGATAPPGRGAFTPTFAEPYGHANDAGREMRRCWWQGVTFQLPATAAGEPHRAGVVIGRCVLAAVIDCTPSVVAGSAPTEGVDPAGEIAGGGKTAGGGRGGGVFVLLLGVAFAGGCSIIPPPRGFIGAVTSGLSSFLSSRRFCKFASCVP